MASWLGGAVWVRYSNGEVRSHLTIVTLALGLGSCQNIPNPYSPPVQRKTFDDFRPRIVRVVNMGDPDAHLSVIQDIDSAPNGSWRWAGKRPSIKVHLRSSEGLKFLMDFTVPQVTFQDTGPVTIAFF